MSDLKFFVNAEALAKEFGDLKKEVEEAISNGVQQVASMTFAKTQELVSQKLKSTREMYLSNLEFAEVQKGVWVVSLKDPALFLEEGRQAGSMLPSLLKNAKTAKDGSRYKVIPFKHSKKSSQVSSSSNMFVNQIKQELKARGIPFKKLEFNSDGSPRLGKLHTINNISSLRPSGRASHGALSGLSIYQRKGSDGKVRRDIMTFRVASSKHTDKWIHPGLEANKFMDQALEWAQQTFDREILPSIMERFNK